MTEQTLQALWLDATETVSLSELCEACAMSEAEIAELMDYGSLAPQLGSAAVHSFSASWVLPLRRASQLRRDYDLDLFAVALVLEHLARIEALEQQVRALEARLRGN